jgi:hypothetical protein
MDYFPEHHLPQSPSPPPQVPSREPSDTQAPSTTSRTKESALETMKEAGELNSSPSPGLKGHASVLGVGSEPLKNDIAGKAIQDVSHAEELSGMDELMTQTTGLIDHPQFSDLTKINQLKEQWNDTDILIMNRTAAAFVHEQHLNGRLSFLGECLFAWDPGQPNELTFVIYERGEDKLTHHASYAIPILTDGKLQWDGQSFENPQQLLIALSNQRLMPINRIAYHESSSMYQLIHGVSFDQLPIDHHIGIVISLLIHHNQYASAADLLERAKQSSNTTAHDFQNIVELVLTTCIQGGHVELFEHCLNAHANSLPARFPFELDEHILKQASDKGLKAIQDLCLKQHHPPKGPEELGTYAVKLARAGQMHALKELVESFSLQFPDLTPTQKNTILACVIAQSPGDFNLYCQALAVEPSGEHILEAMLNQLYGKNIPLLSFLNHPIFSSVNLAPEQINMILYSAVHHPEEFKALLEKFSTPSVQIDVLPGILGNNLGEPILKLVLEKSKPLTVETFNRFTVNSEKLQDIKFLITQIKDLQVAGDLLASCVEKKENELAKFILEQFPDLAKDQSLLLKCVQKASAKANFVALCEVLLPSLSTADPVKIRESLEPLEKASFRFARKTDFTLLEKAIEGHYTEFPLLTAQLTNLSWGPVGDVASMRSALKAYPKLATPILMALAKHGSGIQPGPEAVSLMKEAIAAGGDLDDLPGIAIEFGNVSFFRLMTQANVPLPVANVERYFKKAIQNNFSELMEILSAQNLLNQTIDGKPMIQVAVENNRSAFVAALVKQMPENAPIPSSLIDEAMESGFLTVVRQLKGERIYPEAAAAILTLEPGKLTHTLIQQFLNSHANDVAVMLAEIDKQLSTIPSEEKKETRQAVQQAKEFIQSGGRLIARFPRPAEQVEMHKMYGGTSPSYVAQQRQYGEKRYAITRQVLNGFKNQQWSLMQMFDALADLKHPHASRSSTWRMADTRSGRYYTTGISSRYAIFQKVASQFESQLAADPSSHAADRSEAYSDYSLKHKKIQTGETIELTTVNAKGMKPEWSHTSTGEVKALLEEMNIVLEQFRSYPLPSDAMTVPEELSKIIAHFYWLGCQAMPTERGNSQYVLEMHTLLYEAIGFRTGPLSQEFVLPDCVALCTDFETFYNAYYKTALFDTPPQKMTQ